MSACCRRLAGGQREETYEGLDDAHRPPLLLLLDEERPSQKRDRGRPIQPLPNRGLRHSHVGRIQLHLTAERGRQALRKLRGGDSSREEDYCGTPRCCRGWGRDSGQPRGRAQGVEVEGVRAQALAEEVGASSGVACGRRRTRPVSSRHIASRSRPRTSTQPAKKPPRQPPPCHKRRAAAQQPVGPPGGPCNGRRAAPLPCQGRVRLRQQAGRLAACAAGSWALRAAAAAVAAGCALGHDGGQWGAVSRGRAPSHTILPTPSRPKQNPGTALSCASDMPASASALGTL
jgi:hypothetical protein